MIRRKVGKNLDISEMSNYHLTDYLLVITRGKTNFTMKDHAATSTKLTDRF